MNGDDRRPQQGTRLISIMLTAGAYLVSAGAAFLLVATLWPRYHIHADGQTGLGAGIVALAALLVGVLVLLGAILSAGYVRRAGRSLAIGAVEVRRGGITALMGTAVATGLLVMDGIDAMDARAIGALAGAAVLVVVAAVFVPLLRPAGAPDHLPGS